MSELLRQGLNRRYAIGLQVLAATMRQVLPNTTSSAGCQTIHPDQGDRFHAMLTKALNAAGVTKFPYILIEGPIL